MARRFDRVAASKPLLFVLCLVPLGWIAWDVVHGRLGVDPVAQLEHRSGDWTLRLLLATLAVTPLRMLSKWHWLVRYRRMLGLFAFFYASVHFSIYLAIDLGGFWTQVLAEIAKKPYITVGFTAWLVMLPLALTSTRAMQRRLGRNWLRLHRLVYLAGLCGVLHYLWLVKSGNTLAVSEPMVYLAILLVLLAARVPGWLRRRTPSRAAPLANAVAPRPPA
jgi:sulfoxide reductase heme-binding subunit YedZ